MPCWARSWPGIKVPTIARPRQDCSCVGRLSLRERRQDAAHWQRTKMRASAENTRHIRSDARRYNVCPRVELLDGPVRSYERSVFFCETGGQACDLAPDGVSTRPVRKHLRRQNEQTCSERKQPRVLGEKFRRQENKTKQKRTQSVSVTTRSAARSARAKIDHIGEAHSDNRLMS